MGLTKEGTVWSRELSSLETQGKLVKAERSKAAYNISDESFPGLLEADQSNSLTAPGSPRMGNSKRRSVETPTRHVIIFNLDSIPLGLPKAAPLKLKRVMSFPVVLHYLKIQLNKQNS